MGQLCCLREAQDQGITSVKSKHDKGGPFKLIDQAPSIKTLNRIFQDQIFDNVQNEKKYFYSMYFYNKIQKKILKLSHINKKRSHEISIQQIQKLYQSLKQYIQYLQTIKDNFQLYDQVYEESEKGYLESDAFSFSIDDTLRNVNQQNCSQNFQEQGNNNCCDGLPSNKIILIRSNSQDNNDENTDVGQSEAKDYNQSVLSVNYNKQIQQKIYIQDIQQNIQNEQVSSSQVQNKEKQDLQKYENDGDKMIIKATNSCDSVLLYDMGTDSDKVNSQNNNSLNNQNIQFNNFNQSLDNNNNINNLIQNNFNNKSTENITDNDENQKNNQNQNINTQVIIQRNGQQFSKSNENSNHNNIERELLLTINEEDIQNKTLNNNSTICGNSMLQIGDSNMISKISINDLQNTLPQYEVSEIFGRISERLEQPLFVIELHKILQETKINIDSFRICVEILFKDGGKKQEKLFSTSPLLQQGKSTQIYNIPDIDINEVFEFVSEINLSERSYNKFKISVYYIPNEKRQAKNNQQLNNKIEINKIQQDMNQKNHENENCNNQISIENKSIESHFSLSSNSLNNQDNKNISITTPTSLNNNLNDKLKDDETFINKQNNEIKLSSQIIDLRNYMDQQIHYLDLKFSNKSSKLNINADPLIITIQTRFQFVYDQKNLVNNLMNDLNQQKTILEEILTNLSNPNSLTNNQK